MLFIPQGCEFVVVIFFFIVLTFHLSLERGTTAKRNYIILYEIIRKNPLNFEFIQQEMCTHGAVSHLKWGQAVVFICEDLRNSYFKLDRVALMYRRSNSELITWSGSGQYLPSHSSWVSVWLSEPYDRRPEQGRPTTGCQAVYHGVDNTHCLDRVHSKTPKGQVDLRSELDKYPAYKELVQALFVLWCLLSKLIPPCISSVWKVESSICFRQIPKAIYSR